MTQQTSEGLRFRQALEVEKPLQIIGTVNAYAAMMAKEVKETVTSKMDLTLGN